MFGGYFFNIVPVLFIGMFCLIAFLAIKEIATNKSSPVLSVMAKAVDKRKRTDVNHHANVPTQSVNYYIDFEVESGDIIKFKVNRNEYGNINVGDMGKLTFQGSWFKSFSKDF